MFLFRACIYSRLSTVNPLLLAGERSQAFGHLSWLLGSLRSLCVSGGDPRWPDLSHWLQTKQVLIFENQLHQHTHSKKKKKKGPPPQSLPLLLPFIWTRRNIFSHGQKRPAFVKTPRPAQVTVKVNRKQETSKGDKGHHTLPVSMDVFINV